MKLEKISTITLAVLGGIEIFISISQLIAGASKIFILGIIGGVAMIYGARCIHNLLNNKF